MVLGTRLSPIASVPRVVLCERCPIRRHGVCDQVDPQDFERMALDGPRVRNLAAGSVLFREGDTFDRVFTLQAGWALTSKLFEDGRRQIIRFVLPGDLIGFEGSEATGMAYGAEAITAVRLCGMEHSVFFKECSCSPRFAMNYAEAVTREAMLAWSHVGALGQQSARGRVANLLVELHQRVRAIEGGEGPAVWLPINQTHIADATGLTAVHVCRTLKRMRQEGLLEFSKGRLVLIDPSRLAAVA